MKRKTLISIALILAIATVAATSMQAQAGTPTPDHVRMYIWNPATASNVYPTKAYPQTSYVEVWIDSPAAWYDTAIGIVGVTVSLRWDPNVAEVLIAQKMPDLTGLGEPDSFLGDFLEDPATTHPDYPGGYLWYGFFTTFVGGTKDAVAGTYKETAEAIFGFSTLGRGAGDGPKPVFRYIVRTKSGVDYTTAYSPITLYDCYYTTVDGAKHPVQVVDSGHYGTPPPQFYMSGPPPASFTPAKITDPVGTTWHELYPNYCNWWDLIGWTDNTDGYLSASDQIDMENATGWTYSFHVDAVTITIHWTFKDPDTGPAAAEPAERTEFDITDPIGTAWHQIYPEYSQEFVITSWEDNNANGVFDPSDQFDFEYFGEGIIHWAHLDDVTTDIFLSQKGEPEPPPIPEFPLGLGLMVAMAPAIPIVYLWRTRKKEVKK